MATNGLFYDRVMETSTTTGTGTLTLAGAVTGFRAWSTVGNTNTATYCIEGVDANGVPTGEWETGTGTYTLSGTTLARTLPTAGSAATPVSFSAGTKRVFLVATQAFFHYARYQEEQAQGTQAGTFTTGAWRTRVLNTESEDIHGIGTLASNQVTLVAGFYHVKALAPAIGVNGHSTRLQNITDAATTLIGTAAYALNTPGPSGQCSFVNGRFYIAASKAFELQHSCETTVATNGLGARANQTTEIYSVLEFWRLG